MSVSLSKWKTSDFLWFAVYCCIWLSARWNVGNIWLFAVKLKRRWNECHRDLLKWKNRLKSTFWRHSMPCRWWRRVKSWCGRDKGQSRYCGCGRKAWFKRYGWYCTRYGWLQMHRKWRFFLDFFGISSHMAAMKAWECTLEGRVVIPHRNNNQPTEHSLSLRLGAWPLWPGDGLDKRVHSRVRDG